MKIALLFASLVATCAHGQVLHSSNEPKLILYSGNDLSWVTNYQKAEAFCTSRGRVVASKKEWCDYSKTHPGVEYGEVPIRASSGDSNYLDVEARCNICEGPGKPTTPTTKKPTGKPTPSPTKAPQTNGFCSRPPGCVGRNCQFQCNLPTGYYPDSTDCTAYCFCTGSAAPSRWEQVSPGLVWDPYCGGSRPLNPSNKPLG